MKETSINDDIKKHGWTFSANSLDFFLGSPDFIEDFFSTVVPLLFLWILG
jgi:hypothetical protein